MLGSVIFTAYAIDTTPATAQKGGPPQTSHDKNRHSESVTLTTLGDGHTMPSENAVTRAPSTKVAKLMDTLFDRVERCNVVLRSIRPPGSLTAIELFSTRVPRKESRKSSSINKNAKTSRHAFGDFKTPMQTPGREFAAIRRLAVPYVLPLASLCAQPHLWFHIPANCGRLLQAIPAFARAGSETTPAHACGIRNTR